jgi:hypothetical protein
MVEHMRDIVLGPREQIVDAEHVATFLDQTVDEVGTQEASAAGDHHALSGIVIASQFALPFHAIEQPFGVGG